MTASDALVTFLIVTFFNMIILVANVAILGAIIKLYTDFVKTTVFTKRGGGI